MIVTFLEDRLVEAGLGGDQLAEALLVEHLLAEDLLAEDLWTGG